MDFLGMDRFVIWFPKALLLLLFLALLVYGIANEDISDIIRRGSIL